MIWILISVAILLLDQITKYIVNSSVDISKPINVIDGFFYITHITNKGAAFGMFQNGIIVFVPLTIIISGFIIYFLCYSRHWLYSLALAFILGGAWGNLIDRVFRNGVVDFLYFKFGTYSFWVFNVADMFIVMGTILLAYYLLFLYDSKKIFSKYKI
jgi:signal peptidase II